MKEPFPLQEGQSILIIYKKNDVKEEFLSKIETIEKNSIILTNPFEEKNISVKKGDVLSFYVLEKSYVYNFLSKIEEIKFNQPPKLKINKPKELNHNIRRINLRLPVNIPVKYEVLPLNSSLKHIPIIEGSSMAKNICADGILLETKDKISEKTLKDNDVETKLHFTLPSYPAFNINGKINRIITKDDKTEFVVTFTNISLRDRENIIRFIHITQQNNIMEKTILEKL
ncbi:PilZ domain-containing protein [Candidatus Poribacteria bacterium]|nr:PilZ domain-containing protein [Candidatus Poribacteria bacterium]